MFIKLNPSAEELEPEAMASAKREDAKVTEASRQRLRPMNANGRERCHPLPSVVNPTRCARDRRPRYNGTPNSFSSFHPWSYSVRCSAVGVSVRTSYIFSNGRPTGASLSSILSLYFS